MRAKWKSVNTSWRDVLPIHPAANLFPDMTSDELRTLGEDIVKNGLTSAIVLWQPDPKSPMYFARRQEPPRCDRDGHGQAG